MFRYGWATWRSRAGSGWVLGRVVSGITAVCAAAMVSLAASAAAQAATTKSYATAGEYSFTVPAGVSSLHVVAVGGTGGSSNGSPGGEGADVTANLSVTAGQTLYLEVGGNGPSASNAAGGGGASDIRQSPASAGPSSLASRLLVAAGGGGAGDSFGQGLSSGGNAGSPGTEALGKTGGGQAGSAGAGGTGGCGAPQLTVCGGSGTQGSGGAGGPYINLGPGAGGGLNGGGAAGSAGSNLLPGGGGGGGLYGGGGGDSVINVFQTQGDTGGGGGGGSNLVPTGGTVSLDTKATPSITITYAYATTTTLTATPSSSVVPGVTQVAMKATVSPVTATGTVQFWDIVGTYSSFRFVALGAPVSVINGLATTKATLQTGTFAVVAQYFPAASSAFAGSYSPNVSVAMSTLGSAGVRGVRYRGSDHMGAVRFKLLIRHSSGKAAVYQYILYDLSFATACTRGGVKVPGQVTVTGAGRHERFSLRTKRYVLTGRISGAAESPRVTGTLRVLSGACGGEVLRFSAKLAG